MKANKYLNLIFLFILSITILNCYSYQPRLENLTPDEVIFEFNRILNRIEEPEYFKGILHVTTGKAYEEANTLLEYVLLKDTERITPIADELEQLIDYYKELKIIIVDMQVSEATSDVKVDYYIDSTKSSNLKSIKLLKKENIWKISEILNIESI